MTSFCDDRCTNAKGSSCDCECGGQNHGASKGGELFAIDRSDRENAVSLTDKELYNERDALNEQLERTDEFKSKTEQALEEKSIRARLTYVEEEIDRRENGGAVLGTVSHGTMRTEDLGPAFRSALATLDQKSYREHLAKYGDIDFAEREDETGVDVEEADDAIRDLGDRLNEVAPPGAYFGAHPGDGADYGFWLAEE